jgi:hypothetical protein
MSWLKTNSVGMNQASPVPTLNPTELFSKRKIRDTSRLKAYNQILEQIHTRILTASRSGTDSFIMYTVPPFILGLPRLDLEDCIVYIVYQLRQQSYMVRYTYPNLLFISWAHHEKEYLQKQSPITQAMTPLHVEKKAQTTRVRFADEIRSQGQIATQRSTAMQIQEPQNNINLIQGRAPPRSTNEYRPPTSFLDAVERPAMPIPQKKDILDELWNF